MQPSASIAVRTGRVLASRAESGGTGGVMKGKKLPYGQIRFGSTVPLPGPLRPYASHGENDSLSLDDRSQRITTEDNGVASLAFDGGLQY